MEIAERLFDNVLVLKSSKIYSSRGEMTVIFSGRDMEGIVDGFKMKEQRVYSIPKKGTFFGIHYQDISHPQAKMVSVVKGKGLDYVIDLREDSETYLQWAEISLNADDTRIIYIPAGYGHAFLSMEDNTIQLFAVDEYFMDGYAKQINYKEPKIGLKLPIEVSTIADYDRNAPFLGER